MRIQRVKKRVAKATNKIRRHWSRDEAHRRQAIAEVMQARLFTVLGFQPAPVVER